MLQNNQVLPRTVIQKTMLMGYCFLIAWAQYLQTVWRKLLPQTIVRSRLPPVNGCQYCRPQNDQLSLVEAYPSTQETPLERLTSMPGLIVEAQTSQRLKTQQLPRTFHQFQWLIELVTFSDFSHITHGSEKIKSAHAKSFANAKHAER